MYFAFVRIIPLSFRQAQAFIRAHHRHHPPPLGHKFSLAVVTVNGIVGVAMVGRPVSRMLDDGLTLEVARLCTVGMPNSCSMLYGAARRAAKAMGYRRIVTYTPRPRRRNVAPHERLAASGEVEGEVVELPFPAAKRPAPARRQDPLGVSPRPEQAPLFR